ncbi:zinc finger MYM-type protein 1-like [Arctopsyche grandis]|uniref:zinc finger MYM-type protein 1-like n=1 Tax=Arctopsyche grandis TaxID=121162 RepID=UPI00406D7577
MEGDSTQETILTVKIDAETNNALECCVLDRLFKNPFKNLSIEEKKDVIKRGRPTPDISVTTKMKNYIRRFKSDYYNTSKWLTACKTKTKLYCWPCILFETDKSVWNSFGFFDIGNFHKAKARHERSKSHLFSMTKLKTFGKSRIDLQIINQLRVKIIKHNTEVNSNREIMKSLIDVCCLLTRQELPFRGHNTDSGNYIQFLQTLSKYDTKLSARLQNSNSFTSDNIQNDIIESIGDVLLDEIKREINDARYISIILDETSDIANSSRLSTMVRYVKDGDVQERFLGFSDVSDDRSAKGLSEHVFKTLEKFQCRDKLVAQGYDGAATFSGHLNGLQSLVKTKCPNAILVHCYAHKLNLVLFQSVSFIKECKPFFKTLNGFPHFFSNSTNCINASVKKRFPIVSKTIWNYNPMIVSTVYENKLEFIDFFDSIVDDPDNWDTNTYMAAIGYASSLKDFDFSFQLEIFNYIFALTDALFNTLQTKSLDINYCIEKVNETIHRLKETRNSFPTVYAKIKDGEDIKPPKKRSREDNIDSKYMRLFNEIFDTVVEQINLRFKYLQQLQFIETVNCKKFHKFKLSFPDKLFPSLKSAYADLLDSSKLKCELMAMYHISDFAAKNVTGIMKFLKEMELEEEAFPEIYNLCCLISTIPISTSTVDRTSSCLNRIKTLVRNNKDEDKLSTLSIMWIEKVLLEDMQNRRDFYDKVIEKFIQKSNTRIALAFK